MEKFASFYTKFLDMTKELGHNDSLQRETLLKVLFFCDKHLSADEILVRITQDHRMKISLPTIYNVLAFLEELNLVNVLVTAPYKTKTYELNLKHHDHLICNKCGKVIEFCDSHIEKRQLKILQEYRFIPSNHTMILYGICEECQHHE